MLSEVWSDGRRDYRARPGLGAAKATEGVREGSDRVGLGFWWRAEGPGGQAVVHVQVLGSRSAQWVGPEGSAGCSQVRLNLPQGH